MKKFTEPPFWEDKLTNEPIFKSLVDNFDVIEHELLRLYKIGRFVKLFVKYPVQKKDLKIKKTDWWFIEESTRWNLAPIFGAKHDVNIYQRIGKLRVLGYELLAFVVRTLCPKTTNLLRDYFHDAIILNSSVNVIYPNSEIKPHKHPILNHKHRMNYHLCITDDQDALLTVGYETKSWKRGEILAFKNSGPYRHSVAHRGKNTRIILMLELDVDYLNSYGVFRGVRISDG